MISKLSRLSLPIVATAGVIALLGGCGSDEVTSVKRTTVQTTSDPVVAPPPAAQTTTTTTETYQEK